MNSVLTPESFFTSDVLKSYFLNYLVLKDIAVLEIALSNWELRASIMAQSDTKTVQTEQSKNLSKFRLYDFLRWEREIELIDSPTNLINWLSTRNIVIERLKCVSLDCKGIATLTNARYNLKSAKFHNCRSKSQKDRTRDENMELNLFSILNSSPDLEHIDVSYSYISGDFLVEVAKVCTKLKSITLYSNLTVTDDHLFQITASCPSITEIDISKTSITGNGLAGIAKSCGGLRKLSCMYYANEGNDAGLTDIFKSCRQLEHFETSANVFDDTLLSLSQNCPSIRYIHLDNCSNLSPSGLEGVLSTCKNIEHLILVGFIRCLDTTFEKLVLQSAKLGVCHLHVCSSYLSDIGLVNIANCCENLQVLELDGCEFVSEGGVVAIASMAKRLHTIGYCDLYNVSVESFVKLQHSFPNIRVYKMPCCDPTA